MKAIQISKTGNTDVMAFVDLPTPVPGSGEVLVKISFSGVNFIDIYHREGRYLADLPLILGQEASGVIVQLGTGVAMLHVGDRVVWRGGFGTYAEYAAVATERVVAIPKDISLEQAAASMTQGLAAHYLTHSVGQIKDGDNVLIHAGAGGTGLLMIQIARALGARVFTTVGSEEKAEVAFEAGANEVILYRKESFSKRVRELTSGAGARLVYDSVGRETFEESLACLSRRGLLVLFGASSGAVDPFDLLRLAQMGSLYVTRPVLNDYIATRTELEVRAKDIFDWVKQGQLKLRISDIFPMSEARGAHMTLESRRSSGKILLRV